MSQIFKTDNSLWEKWSEKIHRNGAVFLGSYGQRILVYGSLEKEEWWYWAFDCKMEKEILCLRTKHSPAKISETHLFSRMMSSIRCFVHFSPNLSAEEIGKDSAQCLWPNCEERQRELEIVSRKIRQGVRTWGEEDMGELPALLLASMALYLEGRKRILLVTKSWEETKACAKLLRSMFLCLKVHGHFFSMPNLYEITSNRRIHEKKWLQENPRGERELFFLEGLPQDLSQAMILLTDANTFTWARRAREWGDDLLPSADETFLLHREDVKKAFEKAYTENLSYFDLFDWLKREGNGFVSSISKGRRDSFSVACLRKNGQTILQWLDHMMRQKGIRHHLCNDSLHRMERGMKALLDEKKYVAEEWSGGILLRPKYFEQWLPEYLC